MSLFIISPVKAESIYYTNQYGVKFTEKQYNFYTEMFYDGYQEFVTQDDLNKVISLDLVNQKVEKIILPDLESGLKGSQVTENGRTLTISKSCSSQCLYTLTASWSAIPGTNSYDVIGMRIKNATINTIGTMQLNSVGYSTSSSTPSKTTTNGFGYSVAVPPTSSLVISTSCYTTTGGTAFGSYQHALSTITYNNSNLYYINSAGYGSVQDFYGAAWGVYDGANGVSI